MKSLTILAAAAAAAMTLSACEMYGHHGPDYAVSGGYIDGYYDDAYGPIDGGYWGDDGVFMYRGADHQFHHDDGGHFRKDAAQGYHTAHVPMARPDSDDHHDHG